CLTTKCQRRRRSLIHPRAERLTCRTAQRRAMWGGTTHALRANMSREPGSPEPAHADMGESAEDELLTLTTTAAHQLAQLRSAMAADRSQSPLPLRSELAGARDTLRRAVMAYVRLLRGTGATPVQTIL